MKYPRTLASAIFSCDCQGCGKNHKKYDEIGVPCILNSAPLKRAPRTHLLCFQSPAITGGNSSSGGGSATGAPAPVQPVRINNSTAGRVSNVDPQTAGEALNYLRDHPGFGPGVLQRPDGTGLAPGSRLEPGKDYIFVPNSSPGETSPGFFALLRLGDNESPLASTKTS